MPSVLEIETTQGLAAEQVYPLKVLSTLRVRVIVPSGFGWNVGGGFRMLTFLGRLHAFGPLALLTHSTARTRRFGLNPRPRMVTV